MQKSCTTLKPVLDKPTQRVLLMHKLVKMKTTSLLLALFSSALLMAQPADNARLKPFLDKFWQYMDEIKKVESDAANTGVANKNSEIKSEAPAGNDNNTNKLKIIADNAKRQIEHIKKRDPNYDVSKMEALVQPYIDAKKTAVDAHNARIDALSFHSTDQGCYGLFQKSTTTEYRASGSPVEDEKKHIEQLEEYNKLLQNILANRMAGVEACHKFIKDRTEAAKTRFNEYKTKLGKDDSEPGTRSIYRELVGEEAYWNAARQLYPDITGAAEVHKMIKDFLTSSGGLNGLLANALARKKERLKNTFVPKPLLVNAVLEAEFREAFANEGWGETLLKVSLQSRDWDIVRNNLTGAIICRTQSAYIAAKQKAGNCILYSFTIKQQFNGSSYSSVSSRYSHGVIENEFLCENVNK